MGTIYDPRRFECSCEIRFGDDFSVGRITALELEGAYIACVNPAPKGSVLELRFKVGRVEIQTQADVVHSTTRIGMGVQFTNLRPEHRVAIEGIIGASRDQE